jgi:hypothetical protein
MQPRPVVGPARLTTARGLPTAGLHRATIAFGVTVLFVVFVVIRVLPVGVVFQGRLHGRQVRSEPGAGGGGLQGGVVERQVKGGLQHVGGLACAGVPGPGESAGWRWREGGQAVAGSLAALGLQRQTVRVPCAAHQEVVVSVLWGSATEVLLMAGPSRRRGAQLGLRGQRSPSSVGVPLRGLTRQVHTG